MKLLHTKKHKTFFHVFDSKNMIQFSHGSEINTSCKTSRIELSFNGKKKRIKQKEKQIAENGKN